MTSVLKLMKVIRFSQVFWTNELKNRKFLGKQAADIDRHKQVAATLLISFENQFHLKIKGSYH